MVLIFLLVLFAYSCADCAFMLGNWTNELGSLALFDDFVGGTFIGRYETKATNNAHYCHSDQVASTLFGTYQDTKDGCLVSFSVQWDMCDQNNNTKYSVTTWTGKYFTEDKQFKTTWFW